MKKVKILSHLQEFRAILPNLPVVPRGRRERTAENMLFC